MSQSSVLPHVVILGGGFGGLQAARALKHASVCVTLIDRTNHHVFQPLLYQVATAALETSDIAFPLRSLLRRHKNTEVVMAEAESIDAATRTIHIGSGRSLNYDFLIFAGGAQSFYFGHPELRDFAPGLKTVSDAIECRYRVLSAFERAEQESDPDERQALLTFVIVGGGPTGVELAGAVAELSRHALKRDFRHIDPTQAKVTLVEGGPTILPTYPSDLQAKALKQLNDLGVEVHTATMVRGVDELGVVLGGERIFARTVLWGAGMVGTPIARSLGAPLDRHGRIEVDSKLHPPGLDNVFVIGDAAALVQDGQPVPGVAPAAIQGGHYAARAIIRRLEGKPTQPFRYWNKGELATIGRSKAVAALPGGIKLAGALAQMFYLGIHLVYLSGFRTRIRVFLSWIWSYFTWSRGARVIPTPSRDWEQKHELPRAAKPPAPADQPQPQPH